MSARTRRRRRKTPQQIANDVTRAVGMRRVKVEETECRKCGPGGWSSRYIPRKRTIRLGTARDIHPKVKRALIGHELGHAVADELVCVRRGIPRRRCRYVGQHDRKIMFPIVTRIHRKIGTDPEAARYLERRSGYDPGDDFMHARARSRIARGFRARRRLRRARRRARG